LSFYPEYGGSSSSKADPSGRAVHSKGLWPIACWDCGFESRRGHGYLCCFCCTISTKGKARTNQYRQSTEREQKKKSRRGHGCLFFF
jgi:hypothetical protein